MIGEKDKHSLIVEKDPDILVRAVDKMGKDWLDNQEEKRTLAVIPCCNEEATIASVILKTKRYVDEILVIDDGSIDDTAKLAEELGATIISHKMNKGKSAGIKTGFEYALEKDFDFVVTLDGDGQHNPDEIPAVLGPLINGDLGIDISLGLRSGTSTEMPMWRRAGKRVLDYATSFGNDGYITDSQCGFRAFNKKAVKGIAPRLKGKAFSVESEQLIQANALGLEMAHTNISCRYKNLDTSTESPTSHGMSVLSYVIWLIAEKRPLLFIGVPGFILVLAGIFSGILLLQWYNQYGVFLLSYAIITSIFLMIGAVAMFMALMLHTLPHMIRRAREE